MATVAATVAACLIAAGSPADSAVLTHRVDLIEINHCYDEKGQLMFDQLVFYDWCPTKSHYDVRDWCLLKSALQMPRRNHDTGQYVAMWRDGSVVRRVQAETIRESWTQHDPENIEQQFLPKDQRRSFPKVNVRRRVTAPSPAADRATGQVSTESVLRR